MGEGLLRIENLHVSFRVYRGTLKVLDGVDLAVEKGQSVGLVGETGSGKTTTLKTIMRVLPRQALIPEGRVLFKGDDLLKARPDALLRFRRRGAAMVFQDPAAALNPVFTIGDQLKTVIRFGRDGLKPLDIDSIAIKALKDVSLADPERLLGSYPFQLSGGMKQRVCIAMALAAGSEVLLADEPSTSLDVTISDQILRLIRKLVAAKNLAVVLVTHSLGVVREVTERVCVMYAGRVVEDGLTGRLFARPLHPYTSLLMSCVPKLTGAGISEGIPGRMPDYLNPPPGCRFHPRCARATGRCLKEKPVLSEVEPGHRVACFNYGGASYGER